MVVDAYVACIVLSYEVFVVFKHIIDYERYKGGSLCIEWDA